MKLNFLKGKNVEAEKILKAGIKQANAERLNQQDECPVIDKKLHKYTRQYVGFINEKGQKELWINFVWRNKDFSDERFKTGIISVSDGCSYYWQITVNINSRKLYNFKVNGSS